MEQSGGYTRRKRVLVALCAVVGLVSQSIRVVNGEDGPWSFLAVTMFLLWTTISAWDLYRHDYGARAAHR